MEKTRVNLYLPEDLRQYVLGEAEKNGFNFTTMVQVMLLDWKKQADAMDFTKLVKMLELQNQTELPIDKLTKE